MSRSKHKKPKGKAHTLPESLETRSQSSVTQTASRDATNKRPRIARLIGLGIAIATLIGVPAAIFVFVPQIEITPLEPMSYQDVFSELFVVQNLGNVPVYDVLFSCSPMGIFGVGGGPLLIKRIETEPRLITWKMEKHEKMTERCLIELAGTVSEIHLRTKVYYTSWLNLWFKAELRQFGLINAANGWTWVPEAVSTP